MPDPAKIPPRPEPPMHDTTADLSPDDLSPEIVVRLRGLTKSYREGGQERQILRGLDAEIGRGEFVVLVGKSGSGKSTLLNLLGGMDQPTAGEIEIAGRQLHELDEEQRTLLRRDHIGFIFQFFNLIPTLTVEENLLLPLELQGRLDGATRQAALALLDEVGLADRAQSFPDRLSGGEQQRVAIARALSHDPQLVLADEPTGNLDADTGAQVLELLDRLTRRAGKTLLMVTHSREMVGLADRVWTLDHGHLVESHLLEKRP